MLLIRGIYLLLLHLPTSHITVHAVPHTAVSDFLISRCVASYFKLSLCVRPLLFYCRIPSYRTNREFLSNIWLQTKSQVAIIYYCAARFSPSPQAHVPQVQWHLLTSHDKFCSMSYAKETNHHVRETSSDKGIVFPSYTYLIFSLRSRKLHQPFRIAMGL